MLMFYLSIINTETEREKFEQIYEKYYKLMIYVANGILKNNQDAEDAVHAACLSIIENLNKIDYVSSPQTKSYVSIITKNTALNMLSKRDYLLVSPLDTVEFLVNEKSMVENLIEDNLKDSELIKEINNLPENYRAVLLLNHLYGYSLKEVSATLNLSLDNTRKIHQRAKQKLIKRIKNRGAFYDT